MVSKLVEKYHVKSLGIREEPVKLIQTGPDAARVTSKQAGRSL